MPSNWSCSLARRILGLTEIHSPSRRFFDPRLIRGAVEHGERALVTPPWYAVRRPREPYEWPGLRQQARLLRRMIRRHWFVLLTDPRAPVSIAIQTAMTNPPERPKKRSVYDKMRELLDAGKIQIRPEVAAEWMKEFGVQVKERR
jgi:hypothetical protein